MFGKQKVILIVHSRQVSRKIDFIGGGTSEANPGSGSLKRGFGGTAPGIIHFRGAKWLQILIYKFEHLRSKMG